MTALLFVDLETTGLDPSTLTALEISWTVCDLDGGQRLPLRSRYLALTASDARVVPERRSMGGFRWVRQDSGECQALRMAEDSRLFADWLDCPPKQVIGSAGELSRLLIDDLAEVCDQGQRNPDHRQVVLPGGEVSPYWLREPERVHLCGAGVAQFDQPVLHRLCPEVVARFGQGGMTHYRPVDVSGMQTGLLGGCEDERIAGWAVEHGAPGILDVELDTAPRFAWHHRDIHEWLTRPGKWHRAAPDVARAIVVQRALWFLAGPLRAELDCSR